MACRDYWRVESDAVAAQLRESVIDFTVALDDGDTRLHGEHAVGTGHGKPGIIDVDRE